MRVSLTGVAIIAGCAGIGLVILAILLWLVICPTHSNAPISGGGYCLMFDYNWLGGPAFSFGAILLVVAGIIPRLCGNPKKSLANQFCRDSDPFHDPPRLPRP
jgi:hypothetical protein